MRFRITEDIEQELKDRARETERLLSDIRKRLVGAGFKETKDMNGITFDRTSSFEETDIISQFYIDTNDNRFSCYIARTEPQEKINYSQEGELVKAMESLEDFLENFERLETEE